MRSVAFYAVVLVTLAALAVPAAHAQAPAPGQSVARFVLGGFFPTGDVTINGLDISNNNKFQSTFGVGASYEYRFADTFGADIGIKYFKPDVKGYEVGLNRVITSRARFAPLTAGFNFHFGSDKWRFYAGPELAYVFYSSPTITGFNLKDEFTWGAKIGVDVPWQNNLAFNAAVEYLNAKAKTGGYGDLDPKPIIVTVGIAWTF